jgi:hypothetical protein
MLKLTFYKKKNITLIRENNITGRHYTISNLPLLLDHVVIDAKGLMSKEQCLVIVY